MNLDKIARELAARDRCNSAVEENAVFANYSYEVKAELKHFLFVNTYEEDWELKIGKIFWVTFLAFYGGGSALGATLHNDFTFFLDFSFFFACFFTFAVSSFFRLLVSLKKLLAHHVFLSLTFHDRQLSCIEKLQSRHL
jgi:hypothetical protein